MLSAAVAVALNIAMACYTRRNAALGGFSVNSLDLSMQQKLLPSREFE
jgi:hypothetical protein